MHGKPVYCNNCFKREGDSGYGRNERSGSGKFGKRDFGRSNFEEKRMHSAVCDECGNRCEVPFRPTGEKPVFCSDCFGGNKGGDFSPRSGKSGVSSEQFDELNKKLDKILKVLDIISPKKVHIIGKAERNDEMAETATQESAVESKKETKPKKAAKAKKPVTKKAAAAKPKKAAKAKKR
jgi:CxxC-x17-CxxC domain-containing protein